MRLKCVKFCLIGHGKGKVGKATNLRGQVSLPTLGAGEVAYEVNGSVVWNVFES